MRTQALSRLHDPLPVPIGTSQHLARRLGHTARLGEALERAAKGVRDPGHHDGLQVREDGKVVHGLPVLVAAAAVAAAVGDQRALGHLGRGRLVQPVDEARDTWDAERVRLRDARWRAAVSTARGLAGAARGAKLFGSALGNAAAAPATPGAPPPDVYKRKPGF